MASTIAPSTMRAWMRPTRGPAAQSLKLIETVPTPTIRPDSTDVLIRIAYVALQWSSPLALELLPHWPGLPVRIPEIEYSGVVVAAGKRAPAELQEVGARVQGFRSIPSGILAGTGVLCEYVRSAPEQLIRLPDAVDLVMASGMLCCGSTALKMVRTAAVKPGDRILVNGASSSVGSVLVQICKAKGAHVVGVASGKNEDLVRGLGADEFVDYTIHQSLPAYLQSVYSANPFDYVMDCIGVRALFIDSPNYLKPSGALINIGAVLGGVWGQTRDWVVNSWLPTWLGGVPRRYVMFSTPPDRDSSIIMAKMIEDGSVHVLVDSVWPLEDAIEGYARVSSSRARGKVIIKVDKDAQ